MNISRHLIRDLMNLPYRFLIQEINLFRIPQKDFPGIRQFYPISIPVKKSCLEETLKILDLVGDRRLREVHYLGSFGETIHSGYGQKNL
jgi:hypothetical protein